MSDSIYNPIVIHFYASLCDEISLHIVISINFRPKERDEDAHIISLCDRETKTCSREGEGGKRTVSTLAHLKIRSMNEHVRTYVHTNDVVVAALLSIGRCNRTGNKLDPLVEEHHRAFLLNSRKRRSTRRVSVAFRATVAARHISPPPRWKSFGSNKRRRISHGAVVAGKCSRSLERHVPKVLYFVCNRFFQYGEHSGWLDWMDGCMRYKRSDARCMTTRFLYARVHG